MRDETTINSASLFGTANESLGRATTLGALTLMILACDGRANSNQSGSTCSLGAETCTCYPNLTCDDGLACISRICVMPGVGGAASVSGVGGTTATSSGIPAMGGAVNSGGSVAISGGSNGLGGVTASGGSPAAAGVSAASGAGATGGGNGGAAASCTPVTMSDHDLAALLPAFLGHVARGVGRRDRDRLRLLDRRPYLLLVQQTRAF